MIAFTVFCIQLIFVQYAYSQAAAPPSINNALPPAFTPNIPSLSSQTIAGPNIGLNRAGLSEQMLATAPGPMLAGPVPAGLSGQMLAGGIPAGLSGQMLAGGIPAGLSGQMLAGGIPAGLSGQMMAGGKPAFGPMGAQALTNQQLGLMGPVGVAGNVPYAGNYGGSGNGEVAVAGELPVVGTTAITGQVPMSGKVQFTGSIPAGGIVTISGQCGCGCSGPFNAPYPAKRANNKPYLY